MKRNLSPTFQKTYKHCGYEAKLRYAEGWKPKREGCGLLRGRAVHRLMQMHLLRNYIGVNECLKGYVKEAKEESVEDSLRKRYVFPEPEQKKAYFTWADFGFQIAHALVALKEYLIMDRITPLYESNVPLVEASLTYRILDHDTHAMETVKNIIDLVGVDKTGEPILYDWKIGMKRYTVKEGVSPVDLNDALISYAIAAVENLDQFSFPVKTKIVHTAVTKKGKRSESIDYNGIEGIEVFERVIEESEVEPFLKESRQVAADYNSERFTKNKGDYCITMCSMNKLCLHGDESGYYREEA